MSTTKQAHEYKRLHHLDPSGNPDRGTLRYRVTKDAARAIFHGRPLPAHVRIRRGALRAARRRR